MDAPTWVALVVVVSMLASMAYVAQVSIQYARADIGEQTGARTHSQRVREAIEKTEAFMSGRAPQRSDRGD